MKNIVKQIILGIVLCLPLHLFCWGSKSEFEEESTCRFKNMGGTLPNDMCRILKFLERVKSIIESNKKKADTNTIEEIGETYIFYGPSGTGKTTAARLVAKEADVLLEFHTEKEITEEIQKTKNPTRVITKIYRSANEKAGKENRVVVVVLDGIDKIFKNNPKAVGAICSALCGEIDEHKNKPYILTVLTSNTVRMPDYPLLRRCMQVQWFNPSRKNRAEILKFYDSSISNDQAKLLALVTRNFSGGDLEKFISNAKEYKDEQSSFPFGRSYLKTIISSANLLMDYSADTAKITLCSVAAILMFVYRNRIAKVVLDKWTHFFHNQKEK